MFHSSTLRYVIDLDQVSEVTNSVNVGPGKDVQEFCIFICCTDEAF